MASIKSLVEQAVLADLKQDGTIAAQMPHEHEYSRMKAGDDNNLPERPVRFTVLAEDRGEFYPNSGIKAVAVSVLVEVNAAAETVDPTLLDTLAEKISDRLPATQDENSSRHQAFTTTRLKVYGIMADDGERAHEIDLERERLIQRVFVAAAT